MRHWRTGKALTILLAPFYVLRLSVSTGEACVIVNKQPTPPANPLLAYGQSAIEQDDLRNTTATAAAAAAAHDIDDIFVGYVRRCPSKADTAKLTARTTAFGRGLLLYSGPAEARVALREKPALEAPCDAASTRSATPLDDAHYSFCQVWTNRRVWRRLSKVKLDVVQADDADPELLDGWEVADRYGYDAPPVLAWKQTRFIPRHLLMPDLDVTGAVEAVYDSPASKYWIADDGGLRLGRGAERVPLFRLVCPTRRPETGAGQVSNVVVWDDADAATFRSATALAKRRIVAVGDLHGDFANSLSVFRMAGVIDADNHWAGGNHTVLVQTGDIVDRGHDTILLYELMQRLKTEAARAGGRVVQLLGNHELMNMAEDLRFVSAEDYASFGGPEPRRQAFSQLGSIGKRLFKLHLVHRVGDTVFTHGGITEEWAARGVRMTNRDTTRELPPYVAEKDIYRRYYGWPIFGDSGPAWYRGYAMEAEASICRSLYRALRKMKVKRMVVGHTWQESGRILSRCSNRFFVIDVGISAVYGGYQGALEIESNGRVTALYPDQPVELVAASGAHERQ